MFLKRTGRFDCPDNNNNKGAQRTLVVGGALNSQKVTVITSTYTGSYCQNVSLYSRNWPMRVQLLSAGETFCNHALSNFSLWLTSIVLESGLLIGCGKKLKIMRKFLAIIIMRKHALIMQKLHRIMRFQI